MPKLTEGLTDRVMRSLPVPPKGNVLHYDPTLKGFAGRVTAAGARAFILVYHFNGLERRDTIGGSPEWGASAARAVAKQWKRDVDLGIDPRGAPEPDPELETFGDLAAAFLAHARTKRGRPLRPATVKEYRRCLIVYAAALHDRPVTDVHRADAATLIRTVASKHSTTMAMHCRAAGSRFYSWLIANGYAEHNPFTGTEGYTVPKRSRVLTDGEIAAIWAATEEQSDFGMILRILLWTGCRRGEAGGMRWPELSDGIWTVDGSRTKNHRTLALPIPRQMRKALDAWPRGFGRDLVFGRGPRGFQGWSQSKRRLDARLGFSQSFGLHDCRRTAETRLAGLGISKEIVNKVLNHAAPAVTESYDQWKYLPPKEAALRAWADELDRIVRTVGNVVRLTGER